MWQRACVIMYTDGGYRQKGQGVHKERNKAAGPMTYVQRQAKQQMPRNRRGESASSPQPEAHVSHAAIPTHSTHQGNYMHAPSACNPCACTNFPPMLIC